MVIYTDRHTQFVKNNFCTLRTHIVFENLKSKIYLITIFIYLELNLLCVGHFDFNKLRTCGETCKFVGGVKAGIGGNIFLI